MWMPIWTIPSKVLIAPLVASSLSYGLYAFVSYGDVKKEHTQGSSLEKLREEKEEMNRWSHTLCDPKSPNYNPFLFRKN